MIYRGKTLGTQFTLSLALTHSLIAALFRQRSGSHLQAGAYSVWSISKSVVLRIFIGPFQRMNHSDAYVDWNFCSCSGAETQATLAVGFTAVLCCPLEVWALRPPATGKCWWWWLRVFTHSHSREYARDSLSANSIENIVVVKTECSQTGSVLLGNWQMHAK